MDRKLVSVRCLALSLASASDQRPVASGQRPGAGNKDIRRFMLRHFLIFTSIRFAQICMIYYLTQVHENVTRVSTFNFKLADDSHLVDLKIQFFPLKSVLQMYLSIQT